MTMEEKFRALDALFAAGDLETAEAKLTDWIDQAEGERDLGALLSLYNELEGLYRTTGRAERAVEVSGRALELIGIMGLTGTIHHANTLINRATANTVLGRTARALELYRQAMDLLEGLGQQDSYQMAALCQNMSHCCQQLGEYRQALEFLRRTLELVRRFEGTRGVAGAIKPIPFRLPAAEDLLRGRRPEPTPPAVHRPGGDLQGQHPPGLQ